MESKKTPLRHKEPISKQTHRQNRPVGAAGARREPDTQTREQNGGWGWYVGGLQGLGLRDAKDYIRNGQNLGPTIEPGNYIQYLVINHKGKKINWITFPHSRNKHNIASHYTSIKIKEFSMISTTLHTPLPSQRNGPLNF